MEPDAELAKRGHAISVKSGLAKKAPISAYEPSTLDLPESKYHAILLRDRLYRMDTRPEVLAKIRAALKPGGYFILTDFALPDDARREEATLTEWRELDPKAPSLWTASGYRAALKKLGYELRAFETDSQAYRDMVITSWTSFVDGLSQAELTESFVDEMMREAETWLRRGRALQSGALVHLHALARVPQQGPAQ
jgi:SAM-dependent methyltransferase